MDVKITGVLRSTQDGISGTPAFDYRRNLRIFQGETVKLKLTATYLDGSAVNLANFEAVLTVKEKTGDNLAFVSKTASLVSGEFVFTLAQNETIILPSKSLMYDVWFLGNGAYDCVIPPSNFVVEKSVLNDISLAQAGMPVNPNVVFLIAPEAHLLDNVSAATSVPVPVDPETKGLDIHLYEYLSVIFQVSGPGGSKALVETYWYNLNAKLWTKDPQQGTIAIQAGLPVKFPLEPKAARRIYLRVISIDVGAVVDAWIEGVTYP